MCINPLSPNIQPQVHLEIEPRRHLPVLIEDFLASPNSLSDFQPGFDQFSDSNSLYYGLWNKNLNQKRSSLKLAKHT